MDENEILVGELRQYLSNTPPKLPDPESEHVLQLKRELNLAARVGQQILMQLKLAEKAKEVSELEIARLKSHNAQLINDNQKLAIEQDLLAASIEQQEAEIAELADHLEAARRRTEQMTRAMASAQALEREVEILTDLYANLRQELEASNMQRDEAEKLAKKLAINLSKRLQPAFNELTANKNNEGVVNPSHSSVPRLDTSSGLVVSTDPNPVSTPAESVPVKLRPTLSFQFPNSHQILPTTQPNPSTTQPNSPTTQPTLPTNLQPTNTQLIPNQPTNTQQTLNQPPADISVDSLHTPNMSLPSLIEDLSLDESELPNHSSTDLSWLGDEDLVHPPHAYWMHPTDTASPLRPRLARSQSHESVFSVAAPESVPILRPLRIDNLSNAKQTLAAVNGEQYGEPVKLVRPGARDKLSAMRGAPDRRRWGFFLH